MTLAQELEALTSKDGKLRPLTVVEFGNRNRHSKIGRRLEWNNGKAAHQWRLLQARQLIEVHLFWRPAEPQYLSLRIDRSEPGGGYRRISDILARKDLIEYMMDDAIKDLNQAKQRYAKLEALAGVWSAISKVTSRHQARKPKLLTSRKTVARKSAVRSARKSA